MTNQRGWKGGVYNPGFPPDKAYMERKAKEWADAGFEWPEIKGVQFKRTKNQHKPMRNVVTRVVMVGFDPFNHSGLPEHIEDRVVLDFWANEEQQFILDWVNDAPEGEIRFGGHLNLYGDEHSYMPFPEVDMSVIRGGFQWDEAQIQADAVCRQIAENMGLPEELMKPTLRIPSFANEVSYNGVKLSQIVIPEELEKTRQLVIELTKELAGEDHPNLLTLFVARGGNIRDLTDFFAIVKDSDPAPIRREPPVRSREDERGHEQSLRDSVRGIFPLMELEQTGPDLTGVESDNPIFRNTLCPEVQTLEGEFADIDRDTYKVLGVDPGSEPNFSISLVSPYGQSKEGEFIPQVKAYAVGADGVKRDLRDIDFLSVLLGPVEGEFFDGNVERELQKTGLYRPQGGIDVFKVAALAKRNTTVEGELVDKGVEVRVIPDDELPPESTVKIQNATLSGMTLPRRPNPLREHWEKHGDPHEGRIPHIQQFVDITKQTSQPNRSPWGRVPVIDHTSEGFLTLVDDRGNPVSKEEQLEYEQAILKAQEEELTPEEIADREQAIQEASEGKLDYLLEGTQWDPKLRK